jgi:hypothetical protein
VKNRERTFFKKEKVMKKFIVLTIMAMLMASCSEQHLLDDYVSQTSAQIHLVASSLLRKEQKWEVPLQNYCYVLSLLKRLGMGNM